MSSKSYDRYLFKEIISLKTLKRLTFAKGTTFTSLINNRTFCSLPIQFSICLPQQPTPSFIPRGDDAIKITLPYFRTTHVSAASAAPAARAKSTILVITSNFGTVALSLSRHPKITVQEPRAFGDP